jgi:hypothetical protein
MPELSLDELKAKKLCVSPFSRLTSDKGAVTYQRDSRNSGNADATRQWGVRTATGCTQ